MTLERLDMELSVCKVGSISDIDLDGDFYFIGRTDEELSLVCRTRDVPANALAREDGWRGFRVQGELDFSLVGILARISGILAQNNIPLFAVSTYNTDTILVKEGDFERALAVLAEEGIEG